MLCKTWLQFVFMVLTIHVPASIPSFNNIQDPIPHKINTNNTQIGTHRVIKRFAHGLKYPQLPTLPRPNFPFPLHNRDDKGDEGIVEVRSKKKRTKGESGSQEDRTLLTAKKAILLKKAIIAKKAIILAKLKKKAILKHKKKKIRKKFKKKAAIAGIAAYGLNKLSSKGGFTVKTPKVKLTVASPPLKVEDEEEEDISAIVGDDEEEDDEDLEDDSESNKSAYSKKPPQNNNLQTQHKNHQPMHHHNHNNQHQHTQSNQQQPTYQNDASSKKKGKKKSKKKKKKGHKPRPVNLGVKANLYKKFDKFAKQAQNKLSSFVQVDIDFVSGRSALDDMIEPGRFVSRTAPIPNTAELGSSDSYEYVSDVQVPSNFMPSWGKPNWKRVYPYSDRQADGDNTIDERGFSCCLKPVYIHYFTKNEDRNK